MKKAMTEAELDAMKTNAEQATTQEELDRLGKEYVAACLRFECEKPDGALVMLPGGYIALRKWFN
jgi:hypothetical protein